MNIIREGISQHSFFAHIWFNIDDETGEIKTIEWDNPHGFRITIIYTLMKERIKERYSTTRKKGTRIVPSGYYLTKNEKGFDIPDVNLFQYQFQVSRY